MCIRDSGAAVLAFARSASPARMQRSAAFLADEGKTQDLAPRQTRELLETIPPPGNWREGQ
eukprot:3661764-Alexandrium_andersonii.AAC.1